MNFSLVIPSYNEEKRIKPVVENFSDFLSKNIDKYEIIAVCNGCTDTTPKIISALAKKNRSIKLLNFKKKLGKGGAIVQGFKKAQFDNLGFIDADESVSPEEIMFLLNNLQNYDCVIGSRKLKNSRILAKQSLPRRISSRVFNIIINALFNLNIKDTQCGAKVFKKRAIDKIISQIKTKDYEFDVELLWKLKKNKFKIKELPIAWKHKGHSKFSLLNSPKMLLSLIRLRIKND